MWSGVIKHCIRLPLHEGQVSLLLSGVTVHGYRLKLVGLQLLVEHLRTWGEQEKEREEEIIPSKMMKRGRRKLPLKKQKTLNMG